MRSNDIKREELTLFFLAKRLVNRSPCAAPSKRKRTAILFASRTLLHSRLSKNQLFDEAYYDFKEESWFPLYLSNAQDAAEPYPSELETLNTAIRIAMATKPTTPAIATIRIGSRAFVKFVMLRSMSFW